MTEEVKKLACRVCERATDEAGYCDVCDITTVEAWDCVRCGFSNNALACENCGLAKAPEDTTAGVKEELLFEEDDGTPTSGFGWKCPECGRMNFENYESRVCIYPHGEDFRGEGIFKKDRFLGMNIQALFWGLFAVGMFILWFVMASV